VSAKDCPHPSSRRSREETALSRDDGDYVIVDESCRACGHIIFMKRVVAEDVSSEPIPEADYHRGLMTRLPEEQRGE
jgi:hypothetical protein